MEPRSVEPKSAEPRTTEPMPIPVRIEVDPATVRRLWPVIDVYGRIARALSEREPGALSRPA